MLRIMVERVPICNDISADFAEIRTVNDISSATLTSFHKFGSTTVLVPHIYTSITSKGFGFRGQGLCFRVQSLELRI